MRIQESRLIEKWFLKHLTSQILWKYKGQERISFKAKLRKKYDMEIFCAILVFWPYIYTQILD